MIFPISPKKTIWLFLNFFEDEFVKIQEFYQVIIFVIFRENGNLGLKIKILKFLGIQPIDNGLFNIFDV